jgi:two-component system sensor histidine kinase HydH
LPPGAEHKIFEAFHTTRVQGTGLGLAVARRIVELHGGKIRGENHAEGGAVFTLWLPS